MTPCKELRTRLRALASDAAAAAVDMPLKSGGQALMWFAEELLRVMKESDDGKSTATQGPGGGA